MRNVNAIDRWINQCIWRVLSAYNVPVLFGSRNWVCTGVLEYSRVLDSQSSDYKNDVLMFVQWNNTMGWLLTTFSQNVDASSEQLNNPFNGRSRPHPRIWLTRTQWALHHSDSKTSAPITFLHTPSCSPLLTGDACILSPSRHWTDRVERWWAGRLYLKLKDLQPIDPEFNVNGNAPLS